ncbi:MAG: hypothetical protein H7Z21_17950 [Hymenobacter sp.]|nr:hypothetical protein [Hymenobacter sp.]
MAAPRMTPTRLILSILLFAYLLGVGGYLIYSFVTETGVSGQLMDWQMRYLNSSSPRATMLGTLAVFLAGITPLFWLLLRLNKREGYVPDMSGQNPPPAFEGQLKRGLALALVVVSGAVFWVMSNGESRAAAPVRQLDLDASGQVPAATDLARIKGVLAVEQQYVLEQQWASGEVRSRTRYVPLVAQSWHPGQPIRVVLKTLQGAYYDSLRQQVYVFDTSQNFAAAFDGRLTINELPSYVRQAYTRQHLLLATPYYVLNDQAVNQGVYAPTTPYTRWLVLGFGIVCAVAVLTSKKPAIRG